MPNRRLTLTLALFLATTASARAQSLEDQLRAEGAARLAAAAREAGDAKRGAVVFYQPYLACTKCHVSGSNEQALGPDLSKIEKGTSDLHLVESVLDPSKVIRKGFEPLAVTTGAGKTITGLLVEETPLRIVLRDPARGGELVTLPKSEIDERIAGKVSIMPAGQANQLTSRQQFLDLVRYLIEIRDGGPLRASELEPPPSLFVLKLPDYEQHVDHAGMIAGLDARSLERGAAIYRRLCINCHGTHEQPGSLPTSLRFASGQFKNGSDPYALYQTLTRGFGLMPPQTWMVPEQKYDVIHYLREAYLGPHNPSQYARIDEGYLSRLPKGNTRGPEPSKVEPWVTMDYGPSLINTYEIPDEGREEAKPGEGKEAAGGRSANFAYKGIAVRLDSGPGGVSRGSRWMIFDHDTLRMAGAWSGRGFIDWGGIHFDGKHQVHPHVVGEVHASNPAGPGWADPETGRFDDPRLRGRDGRAYGPLPRAWARFRGFYHHRQQVILSYSVGETNVLEQLGLAEARQPIAATEANDAAPIFTRAFDIGPRRRELILRIAERPGSVAAIDAQTATAVSKSDAGGLECGVLPKECGAKIQAASAGGLLLHVPPGDKPIRFTLWMAPYAGSYESHVAAKREVRVDEPARDLGSLTRGGPPRWPERLTTSVEVGKSDGPFAVDVLTHPRDNPWLCQMRFTGLDFHPDGDRMAVCSWDGDVWLVSGLKGLPGATANGDSAASPPQLTWQRIASGLFQPLGLKIIDGAIHLTCRDQIVILRDLNGDGETDFYETLNNDHQVTEHFHEFAMGLQTDDEGNFYYAKSARHALPAIVPHHGTLLRVPRDGSRTDILAKGFRAANGVCLNPDGTFYVTDQEGHWNPKNRINLVRPGGFYGNMFGYHDVVDSSDGAMEQPLCWITNAFDRSPAELLWVGSDAWGPLKGSLLNLSYGEGKIFVAPHEMVNGKPQGGMSPLPIARLPTGIMRGRFHPVDGQLYACGMFAWAGNVTQPGGLYRVRYTERPVHVPLELHAGAQRLEIRFSGAVDREAARDPAHYAVKTWSLRRTERYGSEHYGEMPLKIAAASLSTDGRSIVLEIPELAPTWCMEIRYALETADGRPLSGVIHNTIHELGRSAITR